MYMLYLVVSVEQAGERAIFFIILLVTIIPKINYYRMSYGRIGCRTACKPWGL